MLISAYFLYSTEGLLDIKQSYMYTLLLHIDCYMQKFFCYNNLFKVSVITRQFIRLWIGKNSRAMLPVDSPVDLMFRGRTLPLPSNSLQLLLTSIEEYMAYKLISSKFIVLTSVNAHNY